MGHASPVMAVRRAARKIVPPIVVIASAERIIPKLMVVMVVTPTGPGFELNSDLPLEARLCCEAGLMVLKKFPVGIFEPLSGEFGDSFQFRGDRVLIK